MSWGVVALIESGLLLPRLGTTHARVSWKDGWRDYAISFFGFPCGGPSHCSIQISRDENAGLSKPNEFSATLCPTDGRWTPAKKSVGEVESVVHSDAVRQLDFRERGGSVVAKSLGKNHCRFHDGELSSFGAGCQLKYYLISTSSPLSMASMTACQRASLSKSIMPKLLK